MKLRILTATAMIAMALSAPIVAQAQTPSWTIEQMAVWKVVADSYVDEVAKNGKWPNAYVHDNVVRYTPSRSRSPVIPQLSTIRACSFPSAAPISQRQK